MTLTDPREALADQSNFIGYLVGLAGLARVVHTLAADGDRRSDPPGDSDDFVHLLLGLASLGEAIERLANPATGTTEPDCRGATARLSDQAVAAMSAVLAGSDFLRAPMLATARPEGFKEWHHFVVHGRGFRLLINFSLTNEVSGAGQVRLAPRVIVIAHDEKWTGAIERFDGRALDVSADLGELTIGGNRMTVLPDGYHVAIDLPDKDIRGELHFTSASRPFVVNNQPVGDGRMSWLFVPRLRAQGWLRIGGREHRIENDLAYHDHNWGRFWWGDDFGWTWGTLLPKGPDDPWSMVFLQMTDRSRLRCLSQALYVWHHDEPAAIFRHAAVQTRSDGLLGRAADCTLPPPMRLLLDGEVPGVPERIEITATRAGDKVHAEFRSQSYARLAQPSEVCLDRSTVLCETSGTARASGTINGEDVDFVGTGVFEFLYG